MASMKKVKVGLEILEKYMTDPNDDSGFAFDNEALYAGPEGVRVSDEDEALLKEVGWFWSGHYNCWAKFI